jgi:N12 class adenine-specific DNA methylase
MAVEQELQKWKEFRRGLRAEEQDILDELLDAVRKHADAGSLVCSSSISEIAVMSILVELTKEFKKLAAKTGASMPKGDEH